MIYYITCPGANAVKIGVVSKCSWLDADGSAFARLGTAQTNCPLRLELAALTDGGIAEEKALHARFANHRIHGEWFTLSAELGAHIAQLRKPERRVGARGPKRQEVAA